MALGQQIRTFLAIKIAGTSAEDDMRISHEGRGAEMEIVEADMMRADDGAEVPHALETQIRTYGTGGIGTAKRTADEKCMIRFA
jgi:hypothetical protein